MVHHPSAQPLPNLTIQLLGAFTVRVDGQPVSDAAWRLRKARGLIKLLSLAPGHRLHREQLIDQLWPELDPGSANHNLHQTIYVARRALDAGAGRGNSPYLRFIHDTLVLGPPECLSVDVNEFENAVATARRLRQQPAYHSCLDLYRGMLLPQDRYEDWTSVHRDRLHRQYIGLLMELADLYQLQHDYPSALELLERVLVEDPAHEEGHRALMRLFALTDQRHRALRQYAAMRKALRDDLGVEPAAASQRLYGEILADHFASTADAPDASLTAPAPLTPSLITPMVKLPSLSTFPPTNLPSLLTRFVGGTRTLRQVKDVLAMARLVTIMGAGGYGKTRLALEAAGDLRHTFPDGVWLVELAALEDAAHVPSAVAAAVGLHEIPQPSPFPALCAYFRSKRLLLVLDGAERLIAGCAQFAESLLRACPDLRILVTSREPLHVAGEVTVAVAPLSLPPEDTALSGPELEASDAVRLFVERARAIVPEFCLDPQTARAVTRICRRLDGMPLGIELAAAQLKGVTVSEVADQLDRSFGLYAGSNRTWLFRHPSLNATISRSYHQLSGRERTVFCRLGVLRGHFGSEAVAAICAGADMGPDEVVDCLMALVDKSLVVADPSAAQQVRYRLLGPIRHYAQEQLTAADERETAHQQHALYFLEQAERVMGGRVTPDNLASPEQVQAEYQNLRAALQWAVESHRPGLEARLTAALWRYWWVPHSGATGAPGWSAPPSPGVLPSDADGRSRRLSAAGGLGWSPDDCVRTTAICTESLAICQATGNRQGAALAVTLLGRIAHTRGDIEWAATLYHDGLVRWRELADRWGIALTTGLLALAQPRKHDAHRDTALWHQSIQLFRDDRDRTGVGLLLEAAGATTLQEHDYLHASKLLLQAISVFQECGDQAAVARCQEQTMRATAGSSLHAHSFQRTALHRSSHLLR